MTWHKPKKWVVGEQGTSSDLNLYCRDNLDFLHGSGSWTAVTFQNSWGNYDTSFWNACGYRIGGDKVYLRGMAGLTSGTSASVGYDHSMFTLPSGVRPSYEVYFASCTGSASSVGMDGRVDVMTSGKVCLVTANGGTPGTTGTWVSLDNIEFGLGI